MGNRRFAQVSTSDEEEEGPRTRSSRAQTESRKRKKVKLSEDEEEIESEQAESSNKKRKAKNTREEEPPSAGEDEEPPPEDAKPVGESIRLSGKGRGRRRHYEAFEFDGNRYDLEDPVLLVPEDKVQKPYVAIIKDISQTKDGGMMVTGQWFYRPDEAEKKGGGSWQSRDSRELFYSFHQDEVPAESVMHKCVVHFVPLNKQLPIRKQHPGFIVQKVYDIQNRKLWKLTDQDYEDNKQHEIDILVHKTQSRLGELLDLETEEIVAEEEEQSKIKKTLRKKSISPLDVSREEDATTKPDQQFKVETPGSCSSNASEYFSILLKFNVLTGDTHRDKWLERLLQGIQYICTSDNLCIDENRKGGSDGVVLEEDRKNLESATGSLEKSQRSGKPFVWPDAAFPAITALEEASHEAFSSDSQKYNQKMRQLVFNVRNTPLLARRLLNRELEPSKILSMSPNELKEALTAEEIARKEPEESERIQMTDARCSRCNEFKVGLRDIIQAGHGDRYQLECIACGNSWYASRDEASALTIDGPSSAKSVGTAPWATSKFATISSPRESDKAPNDPSKKTGDTAMPVLETQRSFGKSKNENEKTSKNT
ncbi:hypothetical protein HS088_TW20G00371 [Tripterygium wilfordii]|uniref:Bromo-adjacent domain-containing protein n=1 Tax=Tripterygium wilfordii TaxID=458696 RepID=A0A7J7C795_TRIWF|nr:uncharacterized protein LOC119987319 [Tripterygium wilfordii]KAF5730001.1 hypothetical protein HS088_TW20G00371 [Tripterygium wilfordii]